MTELKIDSQSEVLVHKRFGRMLKIHRTYGLCIFSFLRKARYQAKESITPRRFEFYGISHLLEGRGYLWTPGGGIREYMPGQAVFVIPGMIQDYGGNAACFTEDAVCFYGPVAEALHSSGIIQPGIFEMGTVRRLQPIFDLVTTPVPDAQIKANMLLQQLLVDVYFENKERSLPRKTSVQRLLNLIAASPTRLWTVSEMAEICRQSESQFRRVFRAETGLYPKTYVDNYKMRHAAELLLSSRKSIRQIASGLAYDDPYHFSRRFKQIMGMAPERYRETMSLSGARLDPSR
jgi:AraC-like DNA-binding protein